MIAFSNSFNLSAIIVSGGNFVRLSTYGCIILHNKSFWCEESHDVLRDTVVDDTAVDSVVFADDVEVDDDGADVLLFDDSADDVVVHGADGADGAVDVQLFANVIGRWGLIIGGQLEAPRNATGPCTDKALGYY